MSADRTDPDDPGRDAGPDGDSPVDPAASALARARAAAQGRGSIPADRSGRGGPRRRGGRSTRRERFTGAGPDRYDPQPVGAVVREITTDQGWGTDLAVGGIVGRWRELVGDEVADHSSPERFEGGELVVVAESSAWATQLRLLRHVMLRRLSSGLGADVVTSIVVHGPTGPQWGRGRWRVAGRGPRDTYG